MLNIKTDTGHKNDSKGPQESSTADRFQHNQQKCIPSQSTDISHHIRQYSILLSNIDQTPVAAPGVVKYTNIFTGEATC